jgi:hypothetical protein
MNAWRGSLVTNRIATFTSRDGATMKCLSVLGITLLSETFMSLGNAFPVLVVQEEFAEAIVEGYPRWKFLRLRYGGIRDGGKQCEAQPRIKGKNSAAIVCGLDTVSYKSGVLKQVLIESHVCITAGSGRRITKQSLDIRDTGFAHYCTLSA